MYIRVFLFMIAFCIFIVPASEGVTTLREYPYFYKSPRAMGMGGAYIAIGGQTDTLFYNPAGLGTMPDESGWEVNILGVTGEANENVKDFADDLNDAFDTDDLDGDGDESDDQLRAVNDVLAQYAGDNLHLRLADFSSVGNSFGPLALGVGALGSVRFDGMAHQGFGSTGLLEVNADALYGGIGGLSYELIEGLYVGGALKYFHREALIHTFTSRELVENEDNIEDFITDELRQSGNAVGIDAGVIYQFAQSSSIRPSVGLSALNIGDMDFGDAGEIPMTVNVGVAASADIPVLKTLTVGIDYVDLFNNYEQDSDAGKRLRFGGELELFDTMLVAAAVRAGLYQGYPTFGADIRLSVVTLSYVTYAEEVGAYAGQDDDRRHLVMLNVGW